VPARPAHVAAECQVTRGEHFAETIDFFQEAVDDFVSAIPILVPPLTITASIRLSERQVEQA
jgi:hypothetical protein